MRHGQRPSSDGRALRALVIAHAFPPAAPIGTMRTLRLVRRLSNEGWDTTVVAASPHTYVADTPVDAELMSRVPASVRVIHAPVLRPLVTAAARLRGRRREAAGAVPATPGQGGRRTTTGWVFDALDRMTAIPDKEIGWLLPAAIQSLRAVRSAPPDVIYSSAPPWSGQLVALVVARLTGLPWVADFRDPWARAPWRESWPSYVRQAAAWLEGHVFRRADAVLFATQGNRDEYVSHYGVASAGKCHLVPNGCDVSEFEEATPASGSDDELVLLHAGSLYGARSPLPLFKAAAAALGRGAFRARRLRIRLIGTTARLSGGEDLHAAVGRLGLGDCVEIVPRLPRRDVIGEMARASCLLLLQPGTAVSVPGKVYEYLAIGRPILALTDNDETIDLVRRSGAGIVANPFDERAIENALVSLSAKLPELAAVKAPRYLYDGDEHARTAVAVLRDTARYPGDRRMPATVGGEKRVP